MDDKRVIQHTYVDFKTKCIKAVTASNVNALTAKNIKWRMENPNGYYLSMTPVENKRSTDRYKINMHEITKFSDDEIIGKLLHLFLYKELTANLPLQYDKEKYSDLKKSTVIKNLIIGIHADLHIGGIIVGGDYDFEKQCIIRTEGHSIKLILTSLPFHQYSSDRRLCLRTDTNSDVTRLTYSSMVSDPADMALFDSYSYNTDFSNAETRERFCSKNKSKTFELTFNYEKPAQIFVPNTTDILMSAKVNDLAHNEYVRNNYVGMCKDIVNSDVVKNIVLVAGIGGTGKFFTDIYSEIIERHKLEIMDINNHDNLFETIMVTADFDLLEERNLSRYNLPNSMISYYKTAVYSFDYEFIRPYVDKVETFFDTVLEPNKKYDKTLYVIGCLDTVASRFELFKKIIEYKNSFNKIVYIDAGNKKLSGQVMTVYIKTETGEEKFNEAFNDFQNEIEMDKAVGCAADNEQTPHINFINASTLVRALLQYQVQFSEEMFYYITSVDVVKDMYVQDHNRSVPTSTKNFINVAKVSGEEHKLFNSSYMDRLIYGDSNPLNELNLWTYK